MSININPAGLADSNICLYTAPPVDNPRPPAVARGRKCRGCTNRAGARPPPCNITDTHGCTQCLKVGIPCLISNWAMPPHPDHTTTARPDTYHRWTRCEACEAYEYCDRSTPCLNCFSKKIPCLRPMTNSAIKRAWDQPLPGEDMYGYWIMHGPRHPDHPPSEAAVYDLATHSGWRMGHNYHVEYAFKCYSQMGWISHYWYGPINISRGAPEIASPQGPIYVGHPEGQPTPPPSTRTSLGFDPGATLGFLTIFLKNPHDPASTVAGSSVDHVARPVSAVPSPTVSAPPKPVKRRSTVMARRMQAPQARTAPYPRHLTLGTSSLPGTPSAQQPPIELTPVPPSTPWEGLRTTSCFMGVPAIPLQLPNTEFVDQYNDSMDTDDTLADLKLLMEWNQQQEQHPLPLPIPTSLAGVGVTHPLQYPITNGVPIENDGPFLLDHLLLHRLIPEMTMDDIQSKINQLSMYWQPNSVRFPGGTYDLRYSASDDARFDPSPRSEQLVPLPQPLGPEPTNPEELIVQNEAAFRPNERRINSRWTYRPGYQYGANHIANAPHEEWFPWLQEAFYAVMNDPNDATLIYTTSQPVERIASPGPIPQIYLGMELGTPNFDDEQERRLWNDHPGLACEIDGHPGSSPLAYIPKNRIWANDAVGTVTGSCITCGRPTRGICESTDHRPNHRQYVCCVCDAHSRRNAWELLMQLQVFQKVRRFACKACTAQFLLDPAAEFTHRGGDLYDSQGMTDNNPNYDPRLWTNRHIQGVEPLRWFSHGSLQAPLPHTGCACADKLLDRRLCNAHRANAVAKFLERIYRMAIYALTNFRSLEHCFACQVSLAQDPNDPSNLDEAGMVWMCICCSGLTVGVRSDQIWKPLDQYRIYGD
ncbi:hypothetical protein TruAng_000961 [Truncatella angustata]|nr:hypothetical protein TruAng_000961 [Truncatella angustata]